MVVHLTDKRIKGAKPKAGQWYLWDAVVQGVGVPGLGVKVYPSGKKTFVLQYRCDGKKRRRTLGAWGLRDEGVLNLTEARRLAHEWLARLRRGEDPAVTNPTVRRHHSLDELRARYLQHLTRKAPRSWDTARRNLEKHVPQSLWERRIADISHQDIQDLHTVISRTAPGMANRVVMTLRTMFNRATNNLHWQLPHGNPCTGIDFNPESGRRRALEIEEYRRLSLVLEEAQGAGKIPWQFSALVRVILVVTPRKNEIMPARWSPLPADLLHEYWVRRLKDLLGKREATMYDVESRAALLTKLGRQPYPFLSLDGDHGELVLHNHKTSDRKRSNTTEEKRIYLCPAALEFLHALPSRGVTEWVFPSPRNIHDHLKSPQKRWEELRDLADLGATAEKPAFRLHDARHSFVEVGNRQIGIALKDMAPTISHASVQTTMRYAGGVDYAARVRTRANVDRVGQWIADAMAGRLPH